MEPLTLISIATGLVKATGLDKYIGEKLGGAKGAEVASRVIDAAQMITGDTDPQAALEAIQQNQLLQYQLKMKLLEMETQEAERILADRRDARMMQQAALSQEDVFSKRFVYYFAAAWSAFTMAYIMIITLFSVPESSQRFADTILGFMLGTLIATIINFFFGSSRQSQSKDSVVEALSNLAKSRE